MKLTQLQIENFLSIGQIHLKPTKPIILLAAKNGQGKSNVAEALKFAISRGDYSPRGISKKNQYQMLVNDKTGAKAGGALFTFDNNVEGAFGFNVPKGDFTGPEISEAMRVSLDGQRFASMSIDERRRFILSLGGKTPSPEYCEPILKEKLGGKHLDKIALVLPSLRIGLDNAVKIASEEATKAKGAFRTVSIMTWGSKQADGWKAPVPTMPSGDLAALKQELADHDANTATLNESLGAIKATQEAATQTAARRSQLEASAKKVPELELLYAAAIKERDEYQVLVEQMRQRAQGGKQGLVHDMARFIACQDIPSLGVAAEDEASTLIARYEQEHGSIVQNAEPAGDVAARLPEHERGLQVLVNRAANLQRDLDAAKMAKGQYDALAPADDATDVSAEIAEITGMIDEARAKRVTLANQVLDFEAAERGIAAAKEKTEQAAKHHQDVLAWQLIADQLSPGGIPAQLLAEALAPVNAKLEQATLDTDWPQVRIADDMTISIGQRGYQMESESFQWRADAMIAQAVSEVSGLKLLCLDRVDVLDIPARGQLFAWLDALIEYDSLSCALLFATLKSPPSGLPATVEAHWIEAGAIVQPAQKEAA